MFSMMIVPLDGSPLAERALPYAAALAQRAEGRLVLTRALDGDPHGEPNERQLAEQAEAEAYLERIAADLKTQGLTANIATPRGDVADQIVAEGEERNAGLIVMATHGRDGLARLFSGSVAEEVLHRTHRPIMFIRAGDDRPVGEPFPPRPRVLVPLDGSLFAEAALQLGNDLAQLLDGELVLLSVVSPPSTPTTGELGAAAIPYSESDLEVARRDSQSYLERVAGQYGLDPAVVRSSVEYGGTTEGIVEAVEELNAGLVVMATHAESGLRRFIFGSTATETLHQITVPLVLLRVEDEAAATGNEVTDVPATPDPLAATAVNIA